uniref:Uncharacterized protein n=1 Tax=Callorhinchus milii TaxID=7868 RepID=A0A4W3IRK5_CALMI
AFHRVYCKMDWKHLRLRGCPPPTHRDLKLRNYVPEDVELKERQVPKARPVVAGLGGEAAGWGGGAAGGGWGALMRGVAGWGQGLQGGAVRLGGGTGGWGGITGLGKGLWVGERMGVGRGCCQAEGGSVG